MGGREEEYLRRMRALGYQDSLAGMDDDDIEWGTVQNGGSRTEAGGAAAAAADGVSAGGPRPEGADTPPVRPAIRRKCDTQRAGVLSQRLGQRGGEEKPMQMKPAPSLLSPSRGETRWPAEPTNYWDAVLKRSREDGVRNWFQPTSGNNAKDSGTNWRVDPKGMFPQYESGQPGSEARNRYRDNEVVKAKSSGGYMDAGASRDNEARSGTVDEFTFTADPLESMEVRGGAKSNTYGLVRQNSDGTPRPHQGVDIYAKPGTSVLAVEDGKVLDAGYDKDGYGHWVKIEFEKNGKKHYAFYAHLSEPANVSRGDAVSAGQIIGSSGDSGNAKGMTGADAHLHFEVHTQPGFGSGLEGRRDPMSHFQTKMQVDKNK